jgi:hypothetical protein
MKTDKARDYIHQKLSGGNPPTPPGEPDNRDKLMAAGLSAKLRGEQITADPAEGLRPWAPTDAGAPSDPTDASGQSAEEEARSRLEQDVLDAVDNPDDELHAVAVRLLTAYTALVTLERKKAGTTA